MALLTGQLITGRFSPLTVTGEDSRSVGALAQIGSTASRQVLTTQNLTVVPSNGDPPQTVPTNTLATRYDVAGTQLDLTQAFYVLAVKKSDGSFWAIRQQDVITATSAADYYVTHYVTGQHIRHYQPRNVVVFGPPFDLPIIPANVITEGHFELRTHDWSTAIRTPGAGSDLGWPDLGVMVKTVGTVTPGTEGSIAPSFGPSGWTNVGADMTGWVAAFPVPASFTLQDGGYGDPADDSGPPPDGTVLLAYREFIAPEGTFAYCQLTFRANDICDGIWINGTLITGTQGFFGADRVIIDMPISLFILGGFNTFALQVHRDGGYLAFVVYLDFVRVST